jgi:hypothetical protein
VACVCVVLVSLGAAPKVVVGLANGDANGHVAIGLCEAVTGGAAEAAVGAEHFGAVIRA